MKWTYVRHPMLLEHRYAHSAIAATSIDSSQCQFQRHYACPSSDRLKYGIGVEKFHAKAIKNGSVQNLHDGNYTLSLYVKSHNLEHARKLFDEFSNRDVRTWTILISGFASNGPSTTVLDTLRRMQNEGVRPNQFTLSSVLKCSNLNGVSIGKQIHGWILRNGIGLDVVLNNSILDFYVKCGSFDGAKALFRSMREKDSVSSNIMIGAHLSMGDIEKSLDLFSTLPFKDVATWNTVIDGIMRNGLIQTAFDLLYQMVELGPTFDNVTFSTALNLAASLSNVELGRQIHGRVLRFNVYNDEFIRNSLVNMYCKSGELEKASIFFEKMPWDIVRKMDSSIPNEKSLAKSISLSSMISGYVQNVRYEDAWNTFIAMVREGVVLDKFTLTSILSACAHTGILDLGRQIHAYIQKIGHELDVFFGSSMIYMYAKCGSLSDAWSVFRRYEDLNVVLWTSMISACAVYGQGRDAIQLFELMIGKRIKPNEVSFVAVLCACSHAGLLEEGCKYFSSMKDVYDIKPQFEHFTCMIDLYGRAGCLNEIKEFIYRNGLSKLTAVWRLFLSSCRVHKNIEMGKWVSKKLLQLEPSEAGTYILTSNMCAIQHKWEEAAKMRNLMQKRGVRKQPGQSWIQLKNQIHTFVMGDRSHSQATEIYSYLEKLIERVKEIGYSSDVKLIMQDVEEEQGEVLLGFHSEKLAIAYGIICTAAGAPIQIMKNLRICADCHNFIKFTSQLLGREIIVRDIHRFHHFKDGLCSCGDYW